MAVPPTPPTKGKANSMEILDYLFEKSKPCQHESELPDEKTVLDGYESLRALMTYATWKGEPRQLSNLTVGYSDPEWFARLVDYDNERTTSMTGKTVAEAIESLDKVLCSGAAIWRNWGAGGYGKKKGVRSAASCKRLSGNGKSPGESA